MFKRVQAFIRTHHIIRGMLAYSILWPGGNLIEQTFVEHRTYRNYDWERCCKFSLFGAFITAPSVFYWFRFASIMWPKGDWKTSIFKSITEQVSFDPMTNACFLFGMSLLEGKTIKEAGHHVTEHMFEIYSLGIIYWPCVSSFVFLFVAKRNQVIATSLFSMLWAALLACF